VVDAAGAQALALAFVESLDTWFAAVDDRPVVQWDATTEFNFGWVFYWNSERFLATGDPRHALAGNTPFIVDRRDGAVVPIGTSFPLQASISAYADQWAAIDPAGPNGPAGPAGPTPPTAPAAPADDPAAGPAGGEP
jgi:hypothetical protein